MAEEDIHILPIVFVHTLTPLLDQVCALEKEPISNFFSLFWGSSLCRWNEVQVRVSLSFCEDRQGATRRSTVQRKPAWHQTLQLTIMSTRPTWGPWIHCKSFCGDVVFASSRCLDIQPIGTTLLYVSTGITTTHST